jgi:hypothetical protein
MCEVTESVVEHDPSLSCYPSVTSIKVASSIEPYSCRLCSRFFRAPAWGLDEAHNPSLCQLFLHGQTQ